MWQRIHAALGDSGDRGGIGIIRFPMPPEALHKMDALGYSGQPLRYHWEIAEESRDLKTGGDLETRPPAIAGLIANTNQPEITLSAPTRPGAYRLFGYAFDGKGAAAHVNLPFYVLDK